MFILDIITSAPPLRCFHCLICNSNSYYSFLFKPRILIPGIYYFLILFWMLSEVSERSMGIFYIHNRRNLDMFSTAIRMGRLLCVICNANSFHFLLYNLCIHTHLAWSRVSLYKGFWIYRLQKLVTQKYCGWTEWTYY